MSARDELAAMLSPLVERLCTSHKWIKGRNGPRHVDAPFTAVDLSEHVMRGNAYGLCPIAPGESTCRVAALDLDSHKGGTPFSQMLALAERIAIVLEADGYAPHLFRSSGGHGIHIYLVWDEPQDAYSVREMLRGVLQACELKPGTAGVAAGEVEVFPKQNEVPHDGQGSMFILPFSGKSEPIGEFACWAASVPVPLQIPPTVDVVRSDDTPDLARIKSALDAIPNTGDRELSYDRWRDHIFAIHYATDGSDAGRALAHEFSARSAKYDGEFLDSRVWPYVRNERSGSVVTDRTLFASAAEHGWLDPSIADDFAVVEDSPGAQANPSRFAFVDDDKYASGPPLEFFIHGVMPRAEIGEIFGASGSGKSFIALDMAGAIARGVEWRGRRVKQGRPGYVVAEGAHGFRSRLRAYCVHNDIKSMGVKVLGAVPSLMKKQDIADLIVAIKAAQLDIVFFDTLARMSAGSDENSAQDIGIILDNCAAINKATGAMLVVVHHAGKNADKGARGSSKIKDYLDVEIEVMRSEHDRVATVTKMKDGTGEGDEFGFKLLTVPVDLDDEGEVITSCVIEPVAGTMKEKRRLMPKGAWEKVAFALVDDMTGNDGTLPAEHEIVERYLADNPREEGATGRDTRPQHIKRALDSLADRGALVRHPMGKFGLPGGAE